MKKSNISSIDLLLLGLLRNEPLSAYDLSKMLGIYEMVKISIPAIYKNVRRLYKDGYLDISIKKNTNMPEKKIYSITDEGNKRFFELLELCANNSINYFFDFNVSLLFLASINKDIGMNIINSVSENLEKKQQFLDIQNNMFKEMPFPIPRLGIQHSELNKTLIKWIIDLKEEYKN